MREGRKAGAYYDGDPWMKCPSECFMLRSIFPLPFRFLCRFSCLKRTGFFFFFILFFAFLFCNIVPAGSSPIDLQMTLLGFECCVNVVYGPPGE